MLKKGISVYFKALSWNVRGQTDKEHVPPQGIQLRSKVRTLTPRCSMRGNTTYTE
jgi:hypothetical protein